MTKNNNYYAVLMAGGVGSRFWPVSTSAYPKQFHDMLGTGATLLQKTFYRLNQFVPTENILILTNSNYKNLVLEQLPEVDSQQVVLEPAMRNTAPCILYAALKIQKRNPKAVMIVAPSDHWIEDEAAFANDVIMLQGFRKYASLGKNQIMKRPRNFWPRAISCGTQGYLFGVRTPLLMLSRNNSPNSINCSKRAFKYIIQRMNRTL